MSQNYITFKKFPDATEARAQQQFLIDNGIECIFIDSSAAMGSAMAGELSKEYEIQLHPDSFEKAEELFEKQAESMMSDLPEDYYLLEFSDEELHEVILKHDEWSEFDYVLARKLLAERGKSIDESLIKTLRKERITELAKPEQNQTAWIIFGYLASLAGGFFGIITGYVLYTSQKTLPNGQMVHTYNKQDRMHAKNMLILGCIMLPTMIAIRLLLAD
jgi:hypothetical protein